MGGIRSQQSNQKTLQQRVEALTQPMPGHETQLVDFEQRKTLTPRAAWALIVVAAVLAVAITGFVFFGPEKSSEIAETDQIISPLGRSTEQSQPEETRDASPTETTSEEPEEEIVISVQGQVEKPGLLRLAGGTRIAEALDAAGGTRSGADVLNLNLAEKITDGMQLIVDDHGSAMSLPGDSGSPKTEAEQTKTGIQSSESASQVNINTADAAELERLDGVGPATAKSIIEFRDDHGPFANVEQLMEVRGIGPGKLAALKDGATV